MFSTGLSHNTISEGVLYRPNYDSRDTVVQLLSNAVFGFLNGIKTIFLERAEWNKAYLDASFNFLL